MKKRNRLALHGIPKMNAYSSLFIGFLRGGCPRGGGVTEEP